MSKHGSFFAALVLSAIASVWAASGNDGARVPVLLELFTSEGCSSCPPADRFLSYLDVNQPVAGADLIVLGEHVDYWDSAKWKDRFSSPQYSARQQEYTNKYHLNGVYTPQLVVDGRFGFVGSDTNETSSAIGKAIREPKIPMTISNASREGGRVTAHIDVPGADGIVKGGRGILYIAIAESRAVSHVAGGENKGASLAHVAVMRILKQEGTINLGIASAKDVALAVQSGVGTNGLRLIAFVQDPKSGHILGVVEHKF